MGHKWIKNAKIAYCSLNSWRPPWSVYRGFTWQQWCWEEMEERRHWRHTLRSGKQTRYCSALWDRLIDIEAGRLNWRSRSMRGNPGVTANAAAAWWEILNRKFHPIAEALCGCKAWLHTKARAFWCSVLPGNIDVTIVELQVQHHEDHLFGAIHGASSCALTVRIYICCIFTYVCSLF